MAKNLGIVRLKGSIDGVTYTEGVYGSVSRSQTSLTKKKMDANPNFDTLRKYQREMGMYSKCGALLRRGLGMELRTVKAMRVMQRLNGVLNKVKNEDGVHPLGARTVQGGLQEARGRARVLGYDFYGRTTVMHLLDSVIELDEATGVVRLEDFVAGAMVKAPDRATHVELKAVMMGLDLEHEMVSVTRSEPVILPLDGVMGTVVLTPEGLPEVREVVLYMVQVLFHEEFNGFLELMGRESAALTVLQVGV
jgi:hypothetical protein